MVSSFRAMNPLALLFIWLFGLSVATNSESTQDESYHCATTEEFSSDSDETNMYCGEEDSEETSSTVDDSSIMFFARIDGGETPFVTFSDDFEVKILENKDINFERLFRNTENLELCFVKDNYIADRKAVGSTIPATLRPMVMMRNPAPYKITDVLINQVVLPAFLTIHLTFVDLSFEGC